LVLAVYALAVQSSGRIFQQKKEDVQKAFNDLDKTSDSAKRAQDSEARKKYVRQLGRIHNSIERATTFPRYFDYETAVSFLFFITSAMLCLLSPDYYDLARGSLIAATIFFAVAGITVMNDIRRVLKKEFDDLTPLKADVRKQLDNEKARIVQVELPITKWGLKSEVPMTVSADTTIRELIENADREYGPFPERTYYLVTRLGVLGPQQYAGTIAASGIQSGERVSITDKPRAKGGPGAFTP